ncbi:hypothetical protein KM176_16555 [Pseudooceanicola sp. CBS1P-1]|uniref:DNA cytosine methyltransferase n=2 Tax=Paracoccaceae TaxID=31989 RepID=A0A6L7G503_9RHOB|nr:hypothetical protein [Pseudooceanicola endophyticus]MXN19101.1 hypothetical protein [Pseudooceanicola albus]
MRVLVACECSGVVRRAFDRLGHDAWSCDLKPAEDRSNRHLVCDVRDVLADGWDLMAVMHPPCTRLCNSGVRWLTTPPPGRTLAEMWQELDDGAALFSDCWNAPIPRIAVENPVMHRHAKERIRGYEPFAQTVQPWHFGTEEDGPDNERKRTCFWLKGLPPLKATGTLDGTTARDSVHKASPGAKRATERSRFFPGIADAMAAQWGGYAHSAALAA